LGWDGFHPRWVLSLTEEHQLRLLDILHRFEDRPQELLVFLTNMVFLDKPDGGVPPLPGAALVVETPPATLSGMGEEACRGLLLGLRATQYL
jgi:hypothetical protein